MIGRPLRWATRGRLLHRAYPPAADPGISDSIVPVQGPNYVLAKRIQRWRAAAARRDGQLVSFHVAPSTRTHSVVKNRALAAAFAGAHRFGVEIFEPGTANTLMAALLVHDLSTEPPTHDHPWQDEAYAAVHGGLWRAPYEPRSALGLAAALGLRQRPHLTDAPHSDPTADRALPYPWNTPTGHFRTPLEHRRPGTSVPLDRADRALPSCWNVPSGQFLSRRRTTSAAEVPGRRP